jgi:hypothetical protein
MMAKRKQVFSGNEEQKSIGEPLSHPLGTLPTR